MVAKPVNLSETLDIKGEISWQDIQVQFVSYAVEKAKSSF